MPEQRDGAPDDVGRINRADIERRKEELAQAASGAGGSDNPSRLMGLGLQFVVAVLLFLFIGQWLDSKLGTAPWLMLGGFFLGAGLGFYSLIQVARSEQRRLDKEREQGGKNQDRMP